VRRLGTLAGFIAALLVALCATHPTHAGSVLDQVKAKGVVRVATDPAWPPYSWKDDSGEWHGFDTSVAQEIAKRIGVKVDFLTPQWDAITAGNWKGEWDLSVGSMSPTEDRAKHLVFPIVYYYSPSVLAVHKDNTSILSPADATGKRIGALKASVFEKYLRHEPMGMADEPSAVYKIGEPVVVSYETSEAASNDLAKGDGVALDGMVDDLMYFLFLIKQGAPLKIVGQPVYYGPSALAIEPGDAEFTDVLQSTISDMQADGTLSGLSNKWFGVDLTKKF
jgi:polar amino acid transport system substrate-binding protein